MKNRKIMFLLIIVLITTFLSTTCTKREPEDLIHKKLELRQRLDKKILEIDKKLETLHEKMVVQDSLQEIETKATINKLKVLRAELLQTLNKIENISENEWDNFKNKTDVKLANTDSTLKMILYDPGERLKKPPSLP